MMQDHELVGAQGEGGVSASRIVAELDFKDSWRKRLDDGSNLATT